MGYSRSIIWWKGGDARQTCLPFRQDGLIGGAKREKTGEKNREITRRGVTVLGKIHFQVGVLEIVDTVLAYMQAELSTTRQHLHDNHSSKFPRRKTGKKRECHGAQEQR